MLLEEVRRRLVIQQFWFAGDSWAVCGPTYIKCNGWHWLLPCKGTRGDFQPVLALGLGLVLALDVIPSLFVKHEHTSLEWTRFMRFGFCMHAVARCRCFRRWMWCSLRHAHTNVLLQNVCVLTFMSTKKCGKKNPPHIRKTQWNTSPLIHPEIRWKKCFLHVGFFKVQIQGYHRWRWPRSVQDM
jgi:hypothetical protein